LVFQYVEGYWSLESNLIKIIPLQEFCFWFVTPFMVQVPLFRHDEGDFGSRIVRKMLNWEPQRSNFNGSGTNLIVLQRDERSLDGLGDCYRYFSKSALLQNGKPWAF